MWFSSRKTRCNTRVRSFHRTLPLRLEVLENRTLLSTYLVTNTGDNGGVNPAPGAGTGTLRQAIVDANSNAGPNVIGFNIPGAGIHTIAPLTNLPTTSAVTIDGTTQPGFAVGGPRLIELSGINYSVGNPNNYPYLDDYGLWVRGDSTVKGMAVNCFYIGIAVDGANNNIEGNYIGTDPTGSLALPNQTGVALYGSNNRVGTNGDGVNDEAERNIISGNSANGIGGFGDASTVVAGNYIGTDATGMYAIPNVFGIRGLSARIVGNVISGNTYAGLLDPSGLVQGNLIGTDRTGNTALPNQDGIFMDEVSTVLIGGTTPAARNVITGNGIGILPGFSANGINTTIIQGNYIGRSLSGIDLGNGVGIYQGGGSCLIGGRLPGQGNVISGNGIGIDLERIRGRMPGEVDRIEGNLIVYNRTGVAIVDGTINQVIGGTAPGAGNTIAFNLTGVIVGRNVGVQPPDPFYPYATQNRIVGNSIFGNQGLGIDLSDYGGSSGDGVTLNNSHPPGTGSNLFQNFPVLTAASSGASTHIQGSLNSSPNGSFVLDFYANTAPNPSGYGEGERYLGSTTVNTDANGNASFSTTLAVATSGGEFIAATATDSVGNTSEFSLNVQTPVNAPPVVGAINAPVAPVQINTVVNASAPFTDANAGDTHTAVWNWGDNTTSAGTVSEGNGSGTVTGSHSYTTDGVFALTLTVTDNHGASGQSLFQYVVIYNPSGGFVTGGGWITSPAGAYVPNPSLTGKTDFGIDVKYKSGSTAPTGNTRFTLPAAGQAFQSTSYAWLTISGTMAQYQGTGTINGAGSYGFIATVTDGDLLGGTAPDTFRIRIWDSTKGNGSTSAGLIYDNYGSAPVYNDPSGTALGGGNITIHKSNQTAVGSPGPHPGAGPILTLEKLQPLVRQALARWQEAGATPAQLSPLAQVNYEIVSLPPGILAMTGPGLVWVSPNADGYGWFLDRAPADDSAFTGMASSPAQNHMDLLSVMAHELGHIILGMDESAQPNDVMTEALPLGVRRLPTPYDLGLQPSSAWASSHTRTGLKEPSLMADGVSVRLRDSLFAVGQPTQQFLAVFQAQQPEAPAPGLVVLLSTAREGEGLLPNRPPMTAVGLKYQEISDNGAAGWMGYALDDALVNQLVRNRLG